MKSLGQQIAEARLQRNLRQWELAAIMGVSQPTIADWERNKKRPAPQRLDLLRRLFGLPKGGIDA